MEHVFTLQPTSQLVRHNNRKVCFKYLLTAAVTTCMLPFGHLQPTATIGKRTFSQFGDGTRERSGNKGPKLTIST